MCLGGACDFGKLLIQEREFCGNSQGRAASGPLVQGKGLDWDAQELGHGSVSFGQNVALELGLPFKQSLSCGFPKLGVLYFTIFKWILGWGGSAELSISILYKAGATLLQLFCSFLGCIYHQTCKKILELLL